MFQAWSVTMPTLLSRGHLALITAAAFAIPGIASAQATSSRGVSAFETGYGMTRNQMQHGVDPSTRDANGNRVLMDGTIVTEDSVYSYSKTLGAGDSYAGAGNGGATAIGNYLNVTVNGNYNTVIVNSTQTNNGNVTANNNGATQTGATGTTTDTTSLNGQVNLNGF